MKTGSRSVLAATLLGALLLWGAARLGAVSLAGATLRMLLPHLYSGGGAAVEGGTFRLRESVIAGSGSAAKSGGTFLMTTTTGDPLGSAFADLSTVHPFPNPFRPHAGNDRITFRGLTTRATIRIYTLSGELVRTLVKSDPGTPDLVWTPVTNDSGGRLASGVYFFVAESGSLRKKGKLMVIR